MNIVVAQASQITMCRRSSSQSLEGKQVSMPMQHPFVLVRSVSVDMPKTMMGNPFGIDF